MTGQVPISLRDLQRSFVTEEACAGHLFKMRLDGPVFLAPLSALRRRWLYHCAGCRYQVSLTPPPGSCCTRSARPWETGTPAKPCWASLRWATPISGRPPRVASAVAAPSSPPS